ncbi:MAG TPA: hypothetical protein VEN95_12405 [Actinomycetota bacterium]|nr:hypothetical protein [Actinomycetota bacterium]
MRKLLAATVVVVALLGAAPANASSVSYTERHCTAFLADRTHERWHDARVQVKFLAKRQAIQPERGDAQRLLRHWTRRHIVALSRDCWELTIG